ncbi:MAG: 30S ribosomal protein S20 [Candidatus Omnitrophica bacterium]|nr:30S ribosomal protein S20 [Candidatus Omnitrophota bacterium]
MPNQQAAIKRMRSDAKKRLTNQATLSELHTLYKKLMSQAAANLDEAKAHAKTLISKLDKAVVRGIIPHRRADRKKARIGRLLSAKK